VWASVFECVCVCVCVCVGGIVFACVWIKQKIEHIDFWKLVVLKFFVFTLKVIYIYYVSCFLVSYPFLRQ